MSPYIHEKLLVLCHNDSYFISEVLENKISVQNKIVTKTIKHFICYKSRHSSGYFCMRYYNFGYKYS